MDDLDELRPRKISRKRKVMAILALTMGLGIVGAWAYARYAVAKAPLGGACRWAMHCHAEAPECMRPSVDEDGVCTHRCDAGVDCAPDVRCVRVELDERDDRGVPLSTGYCFPQRLLDERKARRARDGGLH